MQTLKSGRYEISGSWNTATNGLWTLGRDTETGKEVFIKEFLSKRYVDNPKNYENLRRANERAENYRKLTERINAAVSNIARSGGDVIITTDFFRDGNSLYKVNDKVDFMTWNASDVHNHLSVSEIDALMLRLVNAISALHQANILHCDLKPENVFIVQEDEKYVGMVSDFDDSFFMDEVPPKEDIVGTPEYMSPELADYKLSDENELNENLPLGPASDLFSLGILYHVYLTGEMPHFDEIYNDQLFSVLFDEDGTYSLSDKLDSAHHVLIQRLLVASPAWRIGSCEVLAREISKIRSYSAKEYCINLIDRTKPYANNAVELLGTYFISDGVEREEITERVQTVITDDDGKVVLWGILPDMPLYIEWGDEKRKLDWRIHDGIYECTVILTSVTLFTVRVLCDDQPLPDTAVRLMLQSSGKYLALETQTTDAQGRVQYQNLIRDGKYVVECNNAIKPVVWNSENEFIYSMRSYRLKVLHAAKPAEGLPVCLSIIKADGQKHAIVDAVTNSDGIISVCYAANHYRWSVSCGGREEVFNWSENGTYTITLDVRLLVTARMKDTSIPIQHICFAVCRKVSRGYSIIRRSETDANGQADLGRFPSGTYGLVLLSVPDGYVCEDMVIRHPRKITIPDAKKRVRLTVTFKKQVVLEHEDEVVYDTEIPESVSETWRRIVRYRDGHIMLFRSDGSSRELSGENQLGLFGLEKYKGKT